MQPLPDYRIALAQIIGDYLFRCPTHFAARQLHKKGALVFLYEFSLSTRLPGFPFCDGLACHTSEIAFVFRNLHLIETVHSWHANESISSPLGDRDSACISRDNKYATKEPAKSALSWSWWMSDYFPSYTDNTKKLRKEKEAPLSVNGMVSSLMARYWIQFAASDNPNTPSTVNSVEGENIPLPLWSPIFGEFSTSLSSSPWGLSSYLVRVKNQRLDEQQQLLRKLLVDRPALVHRGQINALVRPKKPLLHQMVFDKRTRVVLVESDCICDFWDEIDYKF